MALSTTTGNGLYQWSGTASQSTGYELTYVGDVNNLTGTMSLAWVITQRANDGSYPVLQYSLDGGNTYTSQQVGSETFPQESINESGSVDVTLVGAAGIIVNFVSNGGGVVASPVPWVVQLSINRNSHEGPRWDAQNPFNPLGYNPERLDGVTPNGSYPAQTLATLRIRLLNRLGFVNNAAAPPPGMATLMNEFLQSAQSFLWRRYPALQTRRMFRWKMVPGQRWYSLLDNDDDPQANYHIDPNRQIEWVGVQDTRNVWYPILRGIEPQLYTMIDKPWRPARYEIRGAIEVYPAPDQVYFLWIKGNFGLQSFVNDSDYCTIDSELLFLHSLANAKAHYGQPDASSIESQANTYRGELVAATHQTGHYIPGTRVVPPAVRPTLTNFIGGGVS